MGKLVVMLWGAFAKIILFCPSPFSLSMPSVVRKEREFLAEKRFCAWAGVKLGGGLLYFLGGSGGTGMLLREGGTGTPPLFR
jgi:hypothetical protein